MKTLLLILILCLPVSAQIGGHIELGKDLYSEYRKPDEPPLAYELTKWFVRYEF